MPSTRYQYAGQEITHRGTSKKYLKVIIAWATTALLLAIVTVALWQTGVIFSSSAERGGESESAKNFSKDVTKDVIYVVTTGVPTHVAKCVTSDPASVGSDSKIYFATMGSGIKALSTKTAQVSSIIDQPESIYAVAYDGLRKTFYWTNSYKMYQTRADGSYMETLVDTTYGQFSGLGWDWIAGRVYLVTGGGFVIACDGRAVRSPKCATVLSGQGALSGIALDPNNGTMYFTQSTGSIMKAHMDGSNLATFVTGLSSPAGVVIDHTLQRLYWADAGAGVIQYSSLDDGEAVVTVNQTSSAPWGIALSGQRLYWSLKDENQVSSSAKVGGDICIVYTGSDPITHLVEDSTLPSNRANNCHGHTCDHLCVLSATSFTCLAKN